MPTVVRPSRSVDVLRWPLVGAFLRWRRARATLQLVLLVAAIILVVDGLLGPQLASNNLATVLTWVHYRGLLVAVLLAAGNFFCMGCPFVLVRDAGRQVRQPSLSWPRVLRSKWIGVGLFVAVLFAYELFDLWALPKATAFLVIGYFGAAVAVDLIFRGATFCKYLCPIGQFNFVASTVSPMELTVRESATCRTCRTVDCIKGTRVPGATRPVQRGCELGLFLPLKVGNMDCTFCLDCVHACPHDNIAIGFRVPGAELADTRRRSGIGWFAKRRDIASLAVLFAFGSLLNAFGMVAPVVRVEHWLSNVMHVRTEAPVLAAIFFFSLVIVPLILVSSAAAVTKRVAGDGSSATVVTATNYAYAFVPFGFGMWLAHYGFHFLTGMLTVVPLVQRAAADVFGWAALGDPLWRWVGMRAGAVFPIQCGFVLLGAIGSLAVAYRISERLYPGRPGGPTLPWAAVTVALTIVAIWILAQPMDMRGIGFSG